MRILWHSNAPWAPTGYGNQTLIFTPKLAADGHEVTISAFYGLEGHSLQWQGDITCLPRGQHQYGNDILEAHALASEADMVISLMDVWVLPTDVLARLPWMAWCPIDHEPVPPAVLERLRVARWPVAFSRFGQAQMEAAGLEVHYIPHGVDTEMFKPGDRAKARAALAKLINEQQGKDVIGEGTFLAVMVAANKGMPSRKAFPEVLTAWKQFSDGHPDAHLYLHTDRLGTRGVDFAGLMRLLEIRPETVSFPSLYAYETGSIGPEYLNAVYNAADVLLNPSYGEGFGIPIVEAQAAGCPVIVGDNTAMRELCFAGWKVAGTPIITPMMAWQFMPQVSEIARALEQAYAILGPEASGDGRDDLRAQARHGALAYDAQKVYETYWQPFLERVAGEIGATRRVVAGVAGNGHGKRATLAEKAAARRERYRRQREKAQMAASEEAE